ncbi:hypothetical protein Q1695_015790 [Nippostrongylus brasiliensis]|nr:hypothetical protein Q1695_015790 [Nippostrongylus brasiliensis]
MDSDRVKFDVGGHLFETTLRTIRKSSKLMGLVSDAHRSDDNTEPVFIDREPEYFTDVLNYLREGKIRLTQNATDLERIQEEAEYYCVNSLAELIRAELSLRGPFFVGESVVWRDPDIRRLCADIGVHFDGSTEKLPLCLNAFRDIKGVKEHTCPWCHVTRSVESNNCIFDFPYQVTHHSGVIVKVYGDPCCYEVQFNCGPEHFHVRADMLRLKEERKCE